MRFFIRKQRYRKRSLLQKPLSVFIISLLVGVLSLDYYAYYFQKWFTIQCQNEQECTKILIVADPQIIGVRNEIIHFITPISIWDSDRYLAKTYKIAKRHVKPDIVLFVGDLFDEGSIAYKAEYQSYVARFKAIFNLFENVTYIFVPGDNDIGGEDNEPVKGSKIKLFQDAFGHRDINEIFNMTFYSVNYFRRTIPNVPAVEEFSADNVQLRIIVSHAPLVFRPSVFTDKILNKLQPHLLFAGHEHNSMIVSNEHIVQVRHVIPVTQSDEDVHEFYLKMDAMYEVITPTCSYRMGTLNIGYGYAVIENNALQYTVLWSPSRYHQLRWYIIILVANFWYFIYYYYQLCWRTNNHNV